METSFANYLFVCIMFLCAHIYSSAYREVRRLYLILPNCSYREISPDNPDFYVDAASVGAGV